jgi:hypothetical protein
MVVPDYAQFGGKHCETGSLKNVLAYLGVAAPHTGRPFSEEMLLGIGGGIGMSYWLFRFGEMAFFFIGTRYAEKGPGALFLQQVAKRLGIATKVYETSSAKRGAADLEAVLNAGRPAVVWVDMPMLPYLGIPETAHFGGHAIVVYGLDDGRALIADRAGRAVGVKDSELAAARASKFKPFPPKHKLMDVDPPANPISSQTLERAVVRGISDCCRQLLHGPIQNIGLQALPKWADLLCNEKNPKGWPNVFRKPVSLYGALMTTFIFIEIGGTGGSAFRSMYARFLSEAAALLKEPRLEKVSCQYWECARLWSGVARAALPDWSPELRETRELLTQKNRAFEAQEAGAMEEIERINRRLDKILTGAMKKFPAADGKIPELLGGLRESILRVYEAEVKAVTALEECIQ